MVEMYKFGDGTYVVPLVYHATLCVGYGDHKGGS